MNNNASRLSRFNPVCRGVGMVRMFFVYASLTLLSMLSGSAESVLLQNGFVHTVSGPTITNGFVLIENNRIARVGNADAQTNIPANVRVIDLGGKHLYPGLIALDTSLGLTEIEAVRATRDVSEVGEYTPEVASWVAVNADSELIPVARANGIACFEAAPRGGGVAGQSALMFATGWTYEEMIVKAPAALHLFWPSMELNLTAKERVREPAKVKSIEDQQKERRSKLKALEDFFDEARAYAKARDAAKEGNSSTFKPVPAWEAMTPFLNGERPVVIHADDVRQIRPAVNWAAANQIKIAIAGGRDSGLVVELLGRHRVPVIFECLFVQPVRDTESYDHLFTTPEMLRRAGVKTIFGFGSGGFAATSLRNLPYAAAQAIAFGLPEQEALKGLTLYPAELMGVSDRLGSIEPGKEATIVVFDGNLFDIRSNPRQMWIAGREVSLESRHTKLYERFRNRPGPGSGR